MNRHVEVSMGVVVSALSLLGIGLAAFAPAVYTYGNNWVEAGSTSLWEVGITSDVALYLLVMLAAALSIAVGAYLRSKEMSASAVALLWIGAAVLLAGALLTLPGSDTPVVPSDLHTGSPDSVGIGVYLVIPGLAAFLTAILETFAHTAPHRPPAVPPH